MNNVNNRYSYFKVCAECKDVEKMYRPELWPEGSVVLRFYEPRNVKAPGKAAPASDTTPGGAAVMLS